MYIIPITNCIYTYSNYKNAYIQIMPFVCYEYGVCIYPIKYKIEMIKIKIIYIFGLCESREFWSFVHYCSLLPKTVNIFSTYPINIV